MDINDKQNFLEDEKLFNFIGISDVFLRRRKIIIFSTSVLFSIFTINTLNNFFRNPIYQGSFSLLIADPIDKFKKSGSSFEERVILNNQNIELPTLIQFLKSQQVLRPLEKELNVSSWGLRNGLSIELDGRKPYVAKGILKVSFRGKSKLKTKIILEKLSQRFVAAAKEQRQLRLKTGMEFLNSEYPTIEKKTKSLKTEIENFRKKYKLVDPLLQAELYERNQNDLKFSIKEMEANITRLNSIKNDISNNKIAIGGFNQTFIDLGINTTGVDQELIDKYYKLEKNLATAKTKYVDNSIIVNNLKQRIASLYPLIKKLQINAIDTAININNRKINIAKKSLDEIMNDFKLQPELINQYEELVRELNLTLENLNSIISAKENYQLQIAQKSLPWRVINDPIVSPTPISPNVKQDIIRNILLAFSISILLALLKEVTEKNYINEAQVEKLANLFRIPLLGTIPFIQNISELYPFSKNDDFNENNDELSGNKFLCSESFRSLATSIRFLNLSNNYGNTILITSTKPSEGKTTITSFIAKTLSDLGNKVLLIDADMRKPSIHKNFNIDNIQGLSNLITDSKISIEEIIRKSSVNNLDIITAGISPPDPVYLLSSKNMDRFVKMIKEKPYEYIIFDVPPSETLADANVLSRFTDLNIFLISLNKAQRNSSQKIINKLSKISKGQIGLVINYLKEDNNFLNNYGYKYKYNNEIYKYYNTRYKGKSTENKVMKSGRFNLKFTKNIILKNLVKFKNWIDF